MPKFGEEGIRVILLGPPLFKRGWSGGRTFSGLRPEMKLMRVMSKGEVADWMRKLAEAPQEECRTNACV